MKNKEEAPERLPAPSFTPRTVFFLPAKSRVVDSVRPPRRFGRPGFFLFCLTLGLSASSTGFFPADVLGAQGNPRASADRGLPLLTSGRLFRDNLDFKKNELSRTYRFRVSELSYGVRIRTQGAEVDLDLRVFDESGQEFFRQESNDYNEEVFLYRLGEPALRDGDYTVEFGYYVGLGGIQGGENPSVERADFEISFEEVRFENPQPIPLGRTLSDRLEPAQGMARAYRLDLPPNAGKIRLDVFDTFADIDIFARWGEPFADPYLAGFLSRSYFSREFLIVDAPGTGSQPRIPSRGQNRPNSLYVLVLAKLDEVPAAFKLLASVGGAVPSELRALPKLPEVTGTGTLNPSGEKPVPSAVSAGLDRALLSTVEILSQGGRGTGTVVSPHGWVLTNEHVVRGLDGKPETDVALGFSLDHRRPPESQFRARVVKIDAEKDLALLKIDSGFYGQDLPSAYRFPYLDLSPASNLLMGEELLFLGYPLLGGLGSRSTLTITRGIVSGFEYRGFGTLVKTDAQIGPGNSGGPSLDSSYRLVGLPTTVMSDLSGHLAYIHPVELVPQDWRDLVGKP